MAEDHWRVEIEAMVAKRQEARKAKDWKLADDIKQILTEEPYHVEIIDHAGNTPSAWSVVLPTDTRNDSGSSTRARARPGVVTWTELSSTTTTRIDRPFNGKDDDQKEQLPPSPPLLIATVDSPHYRARLADTLLHLSEQEWCACATGRSTAIAPCTCTGGAVHSCKGTTPTPTIGKCKCSSHPEPCDLLDLTKHPSLGTRKILFEGWRTVLLPKIASLYCQESALHWKHPHQDQRQTRGQDYCDFVLVGEDDMRLSPGTSARRIREECAAAFHAHADVDILSLGHAWSAMAKWRNSANTAINTTLDHHTNGTRQQQPTPTSASPYTIPTTIPNLHSHLYAGGGVHGTTLLAIRIPQGANRLASALDVPRKQQSHIDQYLFHSGQHNLAIALCDPPLVGWAEVETTLTKSGSGHRRKGGGRHSFVPPPAVGTLRWVKRSLLVPSVVD